MKPFKNFIINYPMSYQFLDHLRELGYTVGNYDWMIQHIAHPQLYDASMAYLNQYVHQLNCPITPAIFQCASDMTNDEMMQLYLDFYKTSPSDTIYTAMILRPEMLDDEDFRRDYPDIYENYRDILYAENNERNGLDNSFKSE